jgi:sugar phosphate isomerase/epimerase
MRNQQVNRRTFLQTAGAAAGVGMVGLTHTAHADTEGKGAPHAEKLGWRLGCQTWSFNDVTFFEAVEKTAGLGLHYIEGFPGQRLSPSKTERKLNESLTADERKEVKSFLADRGVKLVSFGVGGVSRAVFDFAKEMGIENLVSEPPFDTFGAIDKLCEEYQINVALHDHPYPSAYWYPRIVLQHCSGRSKRIGACCDTGHWVRSGVNPLSALKMLEGRVIEFHFKDLNEYGSKANDFGRKAHDVPWGTGVADVKGMLTEVKRQGIKPVFSVEYEYNWGHSLPEIAKCVAYFDQVAAELAG